VSCGAPGSNEGSYCRAQISVEEVKMASCLERSNEWRCEHMKLLVEDDKDERIKTLPNKPDEEIKMASCWGSSNEWRLEHMKLLMEDGRDGMIKISPNN